MLRGALNRLRAALNRSEDAAADAESDEAEPDDAGFRPSVLDASVRYAHGDSDSGLESELAQMEETARVLEEQRREN